MEYKSALINSTYAQPRQYNSINNQPIRNSQDVGVLKQVFPQYLYSPPYGFPKRLNGVFLRRISQNLHISSILKTIKDGICLTKWEIVPEKGVELTAQEKAEMQKAIQLMTNPNPEDTFKSFLRKLVEDLIVLESGTYTHVFNRKGELRELRAVDGNSILKNPDVFGSFQSRDDIITDFGYFMNSISMNDSDLNWKTAQSMYGTSYNQKAAYFQYNGGFAYGFPVPYGKSEIVYIQMNPESSGVYTNGSPISDAVDVILALVMGVKYHLDFYLNGNTPEGIINLAGGTPNDIEKVKNQLSNSIKTVDEHNGFERKMGYVMPVTNADSIEFKPLTFNSKDMEILGQQTLLQKILWQRFGLTADEMGDVSNSNRATTGQQTDNAVRKAIMPYLQEIEENINKHTINKFFKGRFKFRFRPDNTQQELTKLEIYKQKVELGIETWQTIAQKEDIDIEELKQFKEENQQQEMNFNMNDENSFMVDDFEKQQEVKSKENPCWEGYEMVGYKIKDGKKVPNCVPIKKKKNETKSQIPNKLNLDNIIDEIEQEITKELSDVQNER